MTGKSLTTVEVVVTVEEAHLDTIVAVAQRLKAAGLTAAQTLTAAGIITGSVAQHDVAGLKKVAGVRTVEVSGDVQIAPPDSNIQ